MECFGQNGHPCAITDRSSNEELVGSKEYRHALELAQQCPTGSRSAQVDDRYSPGALILCPALPFCCISCSALFHPSHPLPDVNPRGCPLPIVPFHNSHSNSRNNNVPLTLPRITPALNSRSSGTSTPASPARNEEMGMVTVVGSSLAVVYA